MNKIRIFLISILIFTSVTIAFIFLYSHEIQETNTTLENIKDIKKILHEAYVKTNMTSLMQTQIEQENTDIIEIEKRFYNKGEIDEYSFGLKLRNLFAELNLSITQYHTIQDKDKVLLEFTLSGSIQDCLELLRVISSYEKFWDIDFLTIKMKPDNTYSDIILRIGYETLE